MTTHTKINMSSCMCSWMIYMSKLQLGKNQRRSMKKFGCQKHAIKLVYWKCSRYPLLIPFALPEGHMSPLYLCRI